MGSASAPPLFNVENGVVVRFELNDEANAGADGGLLLLLLVVAVDVVVALEPLPLVLALALLLLLGPLFFKFQFWTCLE